MKLKSLLTLIAFCSIFSAEGFSQKIVVTESNERIGSGSNNALVVTIYEAETDLVEKRWKSLMKKYDGKVSTGNEIFADDALIKVISENPIDVYAIVENGKKAGEVVLKVAFNLGVGYLNSDQYGTQFREARSIIYDFAHKLSKEMLAKKLKEQEKLLSQLEGQEKDLLKENKNLHEDIAENKERIKKSEEAIKVAEQNIVKNLSDQEKKKAEIEAQKKTVEQAAIREKSVN